MKITTAPKSKKIVIRLGKANVRNPIFAGAGRNTRFNTHKNRQPRAVVNRNWQKDCAS